MSELHRMNRHKLKARIDAYRDKIDEQRIEIGRLSRSLLSATRERDEGRAAILERDATIAEQAARIERLEAAIRTAAEREAVNDAGGNFTAAARALGVCRNRLSKRYRLRATGGSDAAAE